MNEEQILLGWIEDKIRGCHERYMITNTVFLDMRQRAQADAVCRKTKGLNYCFFGGYEDAERAIAVFLPDYIDAKDDRELTDYFSQNEEDNPLGVLRVTQPGHKLLSHRDYLGSLTGLGIKREVIGDILVRENGADVIVLKEISTFLLYHYGKAGRVSLNVDLLPMDQLIVPPGRREEKKDTVASLRLDNVISSAFSLSRSKAAEAISAGLVFVDGLQTGKADRVVSEGSKLVLRGKGKAVLKSVTGPTKKDRLFIVIEKYL